MKRLMNVCQSLHIHLFVIRTRLDWTRSSHANLWTLLSNIRVRKYVLQYSMVDRPVQTSLAQFISLMRISPNHGRNNRSMQTCIGIVMNNKIHQSTLLPLHLQPTKPLRTSMRWSGPHTGQVPTLEHFHRSSKLSV